MAAFNPMGGVPAMTENIVINAMHHPGLGIDHFEHEVTFDEAML